MNPKRCNIAVFISGGGSNLQAIIDNIDNGVLNANIVHVISDKAEAYGLERAKKHRINFHYVNPKRFSSKEEYEQYLINLLGANSEENKVDLIVLAGFMRILGRTFVDYFANRILNIHPSLLPKYKGLNTHQRALDNNDTEHGSTVHVVTTRLDDGPIILQSKIAIEPNDDATRLQHKIQEQEYIIYTQAIKEYWHSLNNTN